MLHDSRCIILGSKQPDKPLPSNFIFVEDDNTDGTNEFQGFIKEFISSLFVILESKRVEKLNEKLEKMDLPTAPIEQEQVVTDSDTRYLLVSYCIDYNQPLYMVTGQLAPLPACPALTWSSQNSSSQLAPPLNKC